MGAGPQLRKEYEVVFTTSDKVELSYGLKGEGRAIVLLHGWSGSSDNFKPVVEELSKKYRLLIYDHRGHGFSAHPNYGYSLERLAQDLEELLDYLNLEDILLVGWSMGAMTLFDYVRQFGTSRLSGIVIVDMTPKLINDEDWKLGLYDGSYEKAEKDRDLSQMFTSFDLFTVGFMKRVMPYLTDELMLQMAEQQAASGVPAPSLLALTGLWHAMGTADYREDLKSLNLPTRIFRGQLKSLYSRETADYISERIPGSSIVEFEGASHMLVLERADKFVKELEKFAQEVW